MEHNCRYCRKPLPEGARICTACGNSQSLLARLAVVLKWIGGATTVISLVLAVISLTGLYKQRLQTQETVAEMVAAAKLLQRDKDYERSWRLFRDAQQLDPGSPLVRRGQEQLVLAWLPDVRVGADQTLSDIVDRTLPVIVRARVNSEGDEAASFQALMGWAHYLILREVPMHEADIEGLYRESLQMDAGNLLGNSFLAHWLMTRKLVLEEALQHINRALKTAREPSQTGFVRDLEWSSLNRMRRQLNPDNPRFQAVCRAQLLVAREILGDAKLNAITRYPDLAAEVLEAYSRFHFGRENWFDDVWPAMAPEQHLQLLDDLSEQLAQRDHLDIHARFIVAHIREKQGNAREALKIYRSLDPEVTDNNLARDWLDAALLRLGDPKSR